MWERRSPDDLRPGHSGRAAASAVVSIAVAVVIVVAVAVFATRSGGDDVVSVPQLEVAVEWFDVLFAALAILAVVGLGVLVASWFDSGESRRSTMAFPSLLVTLGIVVMAVLTVSLLRLLADEGAEFIEDEPLGMAPDTRPQMRTGDELAQSSVSHATAALVLGLVAAVVVSILYWMRRRSRHDVEWDPGPVPDEVDDRRNRVIGLLDGAIDRLRSDPDPRQAVIAAWFHLENTFFVVGMERRASEAPLRYLSRVLEAVEASAPAVTRLTWAFERAMFSTHPIDRSTQLEAVDALVAVRDELDVVSGPIESARR